MGSPADVSITVSPEVVQGIIQKKIEAAVVAGLAGMQGDIVEKLVAQVLAHKVDEHGKHTDRDYNNKFNFVEWLCEDAIRTLTKKCLMEWIEKERPKIEAAIQKELSMQTKSMAAQYVKSMTDHMHERFHVHLNMSIKTGEKA